MSKEEVITREDFNKLPKGSGENELLHFFENNPDKAFKYNYIMKKLGWEKSNTYKKLKNLEATGLIVKKGEYFALK